MAGDAIVLYVLLTLLCVHAQSISTSTPVPPLQWLNLSGLLRGTTRPPPLKNAAMGYDETSRSIILFGGESEGGFVQSQTYLLDLNTLTWSLPNPPANLQQSPPPRSKAVSAMDFAASNRRALIIIGGQGEDGSALSDIWAFDLTSQFWTQVNASNAGPAPRWGAAGGIDIRVPGEQDPVLPGPNHTIYLSGGFDGTMRHSLADVWQLKIAGTLSSNLPGSVLASWERRRLSSDVPTKTDFASVMLSQRLVVSGGCQANGQCQQDASSVFNLEARSVIRPRDCSAPRRGPALVPNLSQASSTFAAQVFLLLGTYDRSAWNDNGSGSRGEIAVMDSLTGSWARILPARDPDSGYPGLREGSVAISSPLSLVGASRPTSSDTLVFGGQDPNGRYLDEVWLLRAYSSVITRSNSTWSGFGDGQLRSGVNAAGTGVRIEYLSECASAIQIPSPSPHPPNEPDPDPPNPVDRVPSSSVLDVHVLHEVLSPISLALLLLNIVLVRAVHSLHHALLAFFLAASFLAAFAVGLAGLVISMVAQTPRAALRTPQAKLALISFAGVYVFIPVVWILSKIPCRRTDRPPTADRTGDEVGVALPVDNSPTNFSTLSSRPNSPRSRAHSWGPSGMLHGSIDGHLSSERDSPSPVAGQRSFQVINRPRPENRRRASEDILSSTLRGSHSLRDVDWLQQRRSLNTVGELDYALSQATKERRLQASMTPESRLSTPITAAPWPNLFTILVHFLVHICLLGLSATTLMKIWFWAPRVAFWVLLAWIIVVYISVLTLSWNGRPRSSVLSIALQHFRRRIHSQPSPTSARPNDTTQSLATPYAHQPQHRVAASGDTDRTEELEADDEDEHSRQRRIEHEIQRREVSIITVPSQRRLWVTNPS